MANVTPFSVCRDLSTQVGSIPWGLVRLLSNIDKRCVFRLSELLIARSNLSYVILQFMVTGAEFCRYFD
jgi:hypothetical protein